MHIFNYAVLTFTCFVNFSFAALVDHLKKPGEKPPIHQMRNIDFIYMINLDQRPEKFAQSAKQLEAYGISPYRFSAVNGWELSLEAINDVGLKYLPGMTPLLATTYLPGETGNGTHEVMGEYGRTYFVHCMARGTIGCALSHISVLQDAWDSGYETIWVLEDDIVVLKNPTVIPDLIDKLDARVGKGNWDVLFTDQDIKGADGQYIPAYGSAKRPDMDCSESARFCKKYTIKKDISPDFRRISARFGAHTMIIRRSGVKKLLDFFYAHQIFFPYDMDNYLPPSIKRYSLTYDVVGNLGGATSDNGGANYKN